jgi:nucleoside-diphosphate-sugar epimerase
MSFDFTGRKAIICGGSRGIGRAIALGLAAAGADVSICARGAETLAATRQEIAAFGHMAHAASADLGDQGALKRYISEAASALGGIDVLVNNASAFGSADDEATWMASLAIDMLAIVHATQAALAFLQESKGCVVNTSSISALRAAARQPPYGAIKAAVIHYTNTQGGDVCAQRYPGKRRRAGIDRISRRGVGQAEDGESEALRRSVGFDTIWANGRAGRGCERCIVSGLSAGVLDHRADDRGGWRAVALVRSHDLSAAAVPPGSSGQDRASRLVDRAV